MNNDLYNRQTGLNLALPSEAVIIGCGGASWTGLLLAMAGVERLTLCDGDIIELHNCNRQLFKPSQVGMNKAEALKQVIQEFRPDCLITVAPFMIDRINVAALPHNALWIIGTDNLASKKMLSREKPDAIVLICEGDEHKELTGEAFIKEYGKVIGVRSGYTIVNQWVANNVLCCALGVIKGISGEPKVITDAVIEPISVTTNESVADWEPEGTDSEVHVEGEPIFNYNELREQGL